MFDESLKGHVLMLDTMAFSREAENVDEAYAIINFMLEPEIAALSANRLWCAATNRIAVPLLGEELVADTALMPTEEMLRDCEFFTEIPAAAMPLFSRVAREILAECP